MKNKEKVYKALKACMKSTAGVEELQGLTAEAASGLLRLKRSYASHLLNELNKEGLVIKVNSRPVHFIDAEFLQEKYNVQFGKKKVFNCISHLNEYIQTREAVKDEHEHKSVSVADPFTQLVGYKGSFKYQVEQCRIAAKYPGAGLPILITGPTGSGKSFLAQIVYEYAEQIGIIEPEAPFIVFNCADYANNPELLSTHIFGHSKAAFTGAEKESKGILEEANGGFLFLDEIHRLPPEGQENLFLFMDKGIFNRIGEKNKSRKSIVRFIFATTEQIDSCILDTFLRRIPITISMPLLSDRPIEERYELILKLFKREAVSLNRGLNISRQVIKALLTAYYKGNVGQLENVIKLTCARSYSNFYCSVDADGYIPINLMMIPEQILDKSNVGPENIMDSISINNVSISCENTMEIEDGCSSLITSVENEVSLQRDFYNTILQILKEFKDSSTKDSIVKKAAVAIDEYFDELIFNRKRLNDNDSTVLRFNLIYSHIQNIYKIFKDRYGLNIQGSIIFKISCFAAKVVELNSSIWESEYDKKSKKYLEILKEYYPVEYNILNKFVSFIETDLDFVLGSMARVSVFFYLMPLIRSRDKNNNTIRAVIIAHGFSTASSIAQVANHIIGESIFESFDMPLNTSSNDIINKLNEYLTEIGAAKGVIILVDMGSLEDIYQGIQKGTYGPIAVLNNVTTQLAIETGSKIIEGFSIQEIAETVITSAKPAYKLIINEKNEKNAIVVTCITGIGTAIKIKELIVKSLGDCSNNVEVLACDYFKLKNNSTKETSISGYNIIAVIGTHNPGIKEVPFFLLEDLVSGNRESDFRRLMEEFIPKDSVENINQLIVKNFSLESVINNLTILNPNKVLDQLEAAISQLQAELNVKFTNEINICLFIHLSCLIERLITKTQINDIDNSEVTKFSECNKNFILICKKSFSDIEKMYSVSIPDPEVYFIYEILNSKMSEIAGHAK